MLVTMRKTILASVIVPACLSQSVMAQDPMPVTTDTAEYCITLADRMDAQGEMPPHARLLWASGRELCQHGHVRGGLIHLRRAMLMLRGAAE